MTAEMWVKILTFSSGMVGLVAAFLAAVPSIDDGTKVIVGAAVTLIVGAIDFALAIFFQVKKPIERAFDAGANAQLVAQSLRPGHPVTYKTK